MFQKGKLNIHEKILLLLQAEKWCSDGMDRLGARWTITPDASAAGIIRDIDAFLKEASVFKLDNPKEFHNLFKTHATQEMNERLPEVLQEITDYND